MAGEQARWILTVYTTDAIHTGLPPASDLWIYRRIHFGWDHLLDKVCFAGSLIKIDGYCWLCQMEQRKPANISACNSFLRTGTGAHDPKMK